MNLNEMSQEKMERKLKELYIKIENLEEQIQQLIILREDLIEQSELAETILMFKYNRNDRLNKFNQ
jgi:hypothetical protein